MLVQLEHLSKFYKDLLKNVDIHGKTVAFYKRRVTTAADFIAIVGNYEHRDPFFEDRERMVEMFNSAELIHLLQDVRRNRIDIAPFIKMEPVSKEVVIDIRKMYDQRMALIKLEELAAIKLSNPKAFAFSYQNKIVSSVKIDERIFFYLDVLKGTPNGIEAAFKWCQSQPPDVFQMPSEIILKKAALQPARPVTYNIACKKNFQTRKRKP
jgi:hypothetical protein